MRHVGTLALALVLTLGTGALTTGVLAQDKEKTPAKKTPEKKAPAKDAAAEPEAGKQSAWVKLCEKASGIVKNKDGKEEKKDLDICLTHHERLDGNTGMVLVSAALRNVEGQSKDHFMVMVPLGMMIQAGMRATVYPKDAWEKVQKKEKVDEAKLKAIKLAYTLCHPAGCTAEVEVTPELLADLKSGGGLVVFTIGANGAPVGFPVPLNGFEQALAGKPVDNKQYGEARRALMQQIAARQQELADQQRKEFEAKQKAAAPAEKSEKKK
jgi:invasion protein IalB